MSKQTNKTLMIIRKMQMLCYVLCIIDLHLYFMVFVYI